MPEESGSLQAIFDILNMVTESIQRVLNQNDVVVEDEPVPDSVEVEAEPATSDDVDVDVDFEVATEAELEPKVKLEKFLNHILTKLLGITYISNFGPLKENFLKPGDENHTYTDEFAELLKDFNLDPEMGSPQSFGEFQNLLNNAKVHDLETAMLLKKLFENIADKINRLDNVAFSNALRPAIKTYIRTNYGRLASALALDRLVIGAIKSIIKQVLSTDINIEGRTYAEVVKNGANTFLLQPLLNRISAEITRLRAEEELKRMQDEETSQKEVAQEVEEDTPTTTQELETETETEEGSTTPEEDPKIFQEATASIEEVIKQSREKIEICAKTISENQPAEDKLKELEELINGADQLIQVDERKLQKIIGKLKEPKKMISEMLKNTESIDSESIKPLIENIQRLQEPPINLYLPNEHFISDLTNAVSLPQEEETPSRRGNLIVRAWRGVLSLFTTSTEEPQPAEQAETTQPTIADLLNSLQSILEEKTEEISGAASAIEDTKTNLDSIRTQLGELQEQEKIKQEEIKKQQEEIKQKQEEEIKQKQEEEIKQKQEEEIKQRQLDQLKTIKQDLEQLKNKLKNIEKKHPVLFWLHKTFKTKRFNSYTTNKNMLEELLKSPVEPPGEGTENLQKTIEGTENLQKTIEGILPQRWMSSQNQDEIQAHDVENDQTL